MGTHTYWMEWSHIRETRRRPTGPYLFFLVIMSFSFFLSFFLSFFVKCVFATMLLLYAQRREQLQVFVDELVCLCVCLQAIVGSIWKAPVTGQNDGEIEGRWAPCAYLLSVHTDA